MEIVVIKDIVDGRVIITDQDILCNLPFHPKIVKYLPLIEGADNVNSAGLMEDHVLIPQGYVMLGFLLDPRSHMGVCRPHSDDVEQVLEEILHTCQAGSFSNA